MRSKPKRNAQLKPFGIRPLIFCIIIFLNFCTSLLRREFLFTYWILAGVALKITKQQKNEKKILLFDLMACRTGIKEKNATN